MNMNVEQNAMMFINVNSGLDKYQDKGKRVSLLFSGKEEGLSEYSKLT
jgi:hypothetical protein